MVTTKRFYIAGSFKQLPTITAVATSLVAQGLTQTYDWTKVKPTPDLAALREIATAEYAGVTACDCFVFIFPGGKGANVEFGIATALNKPIYMLDTTNQLDDPAATSSFYCMAHVHQFRGTAAAFADYIVQLETER